MRKFLNSVLLALFLFVLLGSHCSGNDCGPTFRSLAKDEVCENCELKIPKIIHQIWHSWKHGGDEISPFYQQFVDRLKKNETGWKYEFWDASRSRDFIQNHYPDFLKTYDGYDKPVKRHDALRYFIMDHYGGVYLDMGFLSIKDIEPLLRGKDLVFSEQTSICHSVANGFLASIPKHPFWQFLTSKLEIRKNDSIIYATGPVFLTEMIHEYVKSNEGASILPSKYMFPFGWYEKQNETAKKCIENYDACKKIYPDAYLVNFWRGSWLDQ